MKLVIVEDNPTLAELTAEILHPLEGQAQQIEAITLASEMQTAVRCDPGHDAVPCEGTFPLSHKPRFSVEDGDVIRQEAIPRGVHFVLDIGSIRALDGARESGSLAFAKPAAIEEIYAALTPHPLPVVAKSPRESGRIAEYLNFAGENHVPDL